MSDYVFYLDEIILAAKQIEKLTAQVSEADFCANETLVIGVARFLEAAGAAAKGMPLNVRKNNPDIDWRKWALFSDFLVGDYPKVDAAMVWDVIKNKLPALKAKAEKLLE